MDPKSLIELTLESKSPWWLIGNCFLGSVEPLRGLLRVKD